MLGNLTEGVMYMLLVYWLGPLRPLLESEPSLVWFLQRFEELRHDMQTLRRNPQAAIEVARQAAGRLDLLHDDRLRALWYGLLALELAASDPARRARYKDARDRILDRGLKMVNASYVDEAAEADLVVGRIDEDVLDLLRASAFGEGTVFDLFEAWRAAARELGEVDRERTRIEAEFTSHERGAYHRLRTDWMRTVKAFRTMVALVDPDKAALMLEKLDEMEQRADLRVAQRRAQGEGAAAPAEGAAEGAAPGAEVDDPDAAEMAEELSGAAGAEGDDIGEPGGGSAGGGSAGSSAPDADADDIGEPGSGPAAGGASADDADDDDQPRAPLRPIPR